MYMNGISKYMSGLVPRQRVGASLAGIDPFGLAMQALSLVGAGSPSSIQGAASPSLSVATNVQTTVSPQISPVFVQQDSPQDSPVGAATMQTAPVNQNAGAAPNPQPMFSTPVTGAIPGMDNASGFLPTGTALYPNTASSANTKTLAAAGIGVLAIALIAKMGSKKSAAKGRRR